MRNNETTRRTESPKSAPLKGKKASGRKDDTIRDEEEEVEDKGRFASDELDEEEDDVKLADDESEDELEASDEEDEEEEFDEEDELDIEDEDSGSRLHGSDELN